MSDVDVDVMCMCMSMSMCLLYTTRTCHEHATRMHVHMQNVGSVWPHVDHFEQAGRGAQQLTPGPCLPLPEAGATKVLRSSRGTGVCHRRRCRRRRPSTCSATRARRSRTASCRWPLRSGTGACVRTGWLARAHTHTVRSGMGLCGWRKAHGALSAIIAGDATRVETGGRMEESV